MARSLQVERMNDQRGLACVKTAAASINRGKKESAGKNWNEINL
jgi:hypothetical protein